MNYPYYNPQMMYQQPQMMRNVEQQPQFGIKGRPVSSIEEVRATSIDFDGSVFFFPDLANRKIYTKQIGMNGAPILNVYELQNIPNDPVVNPSQYVTREEFDATLREIKDFLEKKQEQSQTQANNF